MTADIARITYDATRQYRTVVAQQGRVTLEADENEAAAIASEALRLETIDVVGPTGTPDNGYAPSSGSGAGGVTIGPGIFYLGGWRLELDGKIDLASQPDWLDAPAVSINSGNMLVALLLNEQSVTAVEDQALREVALGGPDGAARTRLMQHFLRLPLTGNTCAAGAALLAQQLALDGVTIDPASLQLVSQARLQAGFVPGPPSTDPCTPSAAGGYLGADNQLVRVTVTAYDAAAKTGTLLWGWNNASILYRAGMVDPLTLMLTGTPVDGEHAPQQNQAVEILRSEASLGDGNFVAAAQGFVTKVAQAYSFDTGELGLADALPAEYQSDKNPLFVRLWQASVPFTAGQTTALDSSSGITVAISLPALPSHIALRPFWRFAVRPSTPVQIYPQRYLEAPQPPDGPRQWIADIAVMTAQPSGSTLVADCRIPFVPLTQQQGGRCCTLVLGPKEVAARGGLQAVLDGLAGTGSGVSLLAGTYPLTAPLALTDKHKGLTLEGCGGTVILQAQGTSLAPFVFGLVQLVGAADVTLRGLDIRMPVVSIGTGASAVQLSLGILASASPGLTVEECNIQATVSATVTAIGLLLAGESTGLAVRRCSFAGSAFVAGAKVYGIVASASSTTLTTLLDDTEISGNSFARLGAGVVTFSDLGLLRCTDNRVTQCATGLYFADRNLGAATGAARQALTDNTNATMALALNTSMQGPMLADIVGSMAQFVPKAPPSPATPVAPTLSAAARNVLIRDMTSRGTDAWHLIAPMQMTAAMVTPAAAPAPGAAATGAAATGAGTAPAAGSIPKELSDTFVKSLDVLQEIAIAAASAGASHNPVLHISGNEVRLATLGTGANTVAGVGIAVILSPRQEATAGAAAGPTGTVLVTANRVLAADPRTTAGALVFPAVAAVTGNVFMQTGAKPEGGAPAFLLAAQRGAEFEVMANVVVTNTLIAPPRAATATTASWNFLNTVA